MVHLWCLQRVKDPDRFNAELERPPAGVATRVSEADLDRDAQSFVAFAAAVGIAPAAPPGPRPADQGVVSPPESGDPSRGRARR